MRGSSGWHFLKNQFMARSPTGFVRGRTSFVRTGKPVTASCACSGFWGKVYVCMRLHRFMRGILAAPEASAQKYLGRKWQPMGQINGDAASVAMPRAKQASFVPLGCDGMFHGFVIYANQAPTIGTRKIFQISRLPFVLLAAFSRKFECQI